MFASQEGCFEIANLLIDADANVNAESTNGYTALMIAAASESEESSYLPFTVEEQGIDEIGRLLRADDTRNKPYKMNIKEKMVIPAGVAYVPLNVRQNERVMKDFFENMQNLSSMNESRGDDPVICGPYLTTLLKWYWASISWDITEPIFMFENGRHQVMIDFTEDGKIYYVDRLDSLKWGSD